MNATTPANVLRLYGNLDFALDVIANRQITLVHTSLLNDPFDPYFFLETDFNEKRAELLRYVEKHHPEDGRWFRKAVTAVYWENTVKKVRSQFDQWKKETFVFSTIGEQQPGASPRDNLYMWGHYGNGHRGVAIEFDTGVLATSLVNHLIKASGSSPDFTDVWAKVEYRSEMPRLTAEHYYNFLKQEYDLASGKVLNEGETDSDRYFNLLGRIKSDVWATENEWRLMWRNDSTRMKIYRCPITAKSIKSVIFGLKMPECAREDFVAEVRNGLPDVQVFHAEKRHGDFALSFKPQSL